MSSVLVTAMDLLENAVLSSEDPMGDSKAELLVSDIGSLLSNNDVAGLGLEMLAAKSLLSSELAA